MDRRERCIFSDPPRLAAATAINRRFHVPRDLWRHQAVFRQKECDWCRNRCWPCLFPFNMLKWRLATLSRPMAYHQFGF